MKMRIGTSLLMTAFLAVACGDDGSPEAPTDNLDDNSSATPSDAAVKKDAAARDATVNRKDAAAATEDANTPDDEDSSVDGPSEESDAATSGSDAGTADAGRRDASASDAGLSDASASDAGKADAGKADAGKADAGSAGSTCDTLTYESFGKTFMTNYCTSCHGSGQAQKNIRLDTLAGVTSAKNKVKSEVAGGQMPPLLSKAPTAAERADLGKWIDCGPK